MTIHVLTGDALLSNFPEGKLTGAIAINRECLIEGPVAFTNLEDFWQERESYLLDAYPESDISYPDDVVFEFEKLKELQQGDEVNLWFENDLFCQINLWFTISLLPENGVAVYRIVPVIDNPEELWNGFGPMSSNELMDCFNKRILLTPEDLQLGKKLWQAYSTANLQELEKLAVIKSKAFPYLKEVCDAHIQRTSTQPGRPEKALKGIIDNGTTSFESAFEQFSEQEGIYGFGDMQVKRIFEQLIR